MAKLNLITDDDYISDDYDCSPIPKRSEAPLSRPRRAAGPLTCEGEIEYGVPSLDTIRACKVLEKALTHVMTKAAIDYYQDQFDRLDFSSVCTIAPEDNIFVQTVGPFLKKRAEKNDQPWIWLTVNPAPQVSFEQFRSKINKCLSKKWITSAMFTLEQRGQQAAQDLGRGFHLHMILPRGKKSKSAAKSEIKNTFKTVCNVDQDSCLNFRLISDTSKEEKLKYLQGLKKPSKLPQVNEDRQWRLQEGLRDFYVHTEDKQIVL